MRNGVPTRSFRVGAPMEGAIFMSNTQTREQCFQHNIFALPLEYEPFVNNVKKGMPLFLFDHAERKLFGVFEAASDGGMDIDRSAFQSTGRSYPAQVCFKIVWKCRPLNEDEFSGAIEENYYMPFKFYFDLSYHQVVQLYRLFDEKRVDRPICNYSKSDNLEKEHSSRGTLEKGSLTPNISPFPADQSRILMPSAFPKISTVGTNYSASTSMHPIVPLGVETDPNVSMPMQTAPFRVQISPVHSSHHDQRKLACHSIGPFLGASTVDGISTEGSTSFSQAARYQCQLVENQSYPLRQGLFEEAFPYDCRHDSLPCGCMNSTDGVRLPANQSYSPSLGCVGNSLPSSQYIIQDLIKGDANFRSSNYPPFAPSCPHFSLPNPEGDAIGNRKDHYDIRRSQNTSDAHIHAAEHQCLSNGKALTPPRLTQEGIPTHPKVPEVSAIGQQKESFPDYIMIPHCREYFDDKRKHIFNCNASGSSGLGNDFRAHKQDQLHRNHGIGAENNATVGGQHKKSSVFSRLSQNRQPPSKEITGPSLNQMIDSLSYGTKQRSIENMTLADDVGKQWVDKQAMDIPCPLAELNLPSLPEGEESTEAPFFNFKRRREVGKLDANLGKEISGQVKRRKLVRPSFGDDSNAACSAKDVQGDGIEDGKHRGREVGTNVLNIDLNRPATEKSDVGNEDGRLVLCPADVKIQTEKGCEICTSKPNCSNTIEVINKQDPSLDNATTAKKISLDLNIENFITMDESKLQTIFAALQELRKLKSVMSNNSEEPKSTTCGEDSKMNMVMKSD